MSYCSECGGLYKHEEDCPTQQGTPKLIDVFGRREVTMISLNERRAEFVYEAARLAAIAAKAPVVPVPLVERELDFRCQFLDVIERQCGPQCLNSPEELHESWIQAHLKMGWIHGEKYDRERRIHPDLVPYDKLGQLEKDKDDVFIMLCDIARRFIR